MKTDEQLIWESYVGSLKHKAIVYHRSNYNLAIDDGGYDTFKSREGDLKVLDYKFFSVGEESRDIFGGGRKYEYMVELEYNPNNIFSPHPNIKGLKVNYIFDNEKIKEDFLKFLNDNLEYFYNTDYLGNDNPNDKEVEEAFERQEGGDRNDKFGLLVHYIRYWNDSWILMENNLFLEYIESKGFDGFTTMEQGFSHIAVKNNFNARIIKGGISPEYSPEKRGVGCLIFAKDTQRYLFGLRSDDVEDSRTWGIWGGSVEDEDASDTLKREVVEETGYTGPIKFHYVNSNNFHGMTYDNYIGTVEKEFKPKLNFEHYDYKWVEYGDWPRPLHYGAKDLIDNLDIKKIDHERTLVKP